jgi:hypothetical protein
LKFQNKELTRKEGDHCLLERYPLLKSKVDLWLFSVNSISNGEINNGWIYKTSIHKLDSKERSIFKQSKCLSITIVYFQVQ